MNPIIPSRVTDKIERQKVSLDEGLDKTILQIKENPDRFRVRY